MTFSWPSHDTPAVKGDTHCWIFAEEPKDRKRPISDMSVGSGCESCCRRNLTADTMGITMYGTLRKNDHLTPWLPGHRPRPHSQAMPTQPITPSHTLITWTQATPTQPITPSHTLLTCTQATPTQSSHAQPITSSHTLLTCTQATSTKWSPAHVANHIILHLDYLYTGHAHTVKPRPHSQSHHLTPCLPVHKPRPLSQSNHLMPCLPVHKPCPCSQSHYLNLTYLSTSHAHGPTQPIICVDCGSTFRAYSMPLAAKCAAWIFNFCICVQHCEVRVQCSSFRCVLWLNDTSYSKSVWRSEQKVAC